MEANCELNTDQGSARKETWHWNTWIRYLPVINIVYGGVRILVYGGKAVMQCKYKENTIASGDNDNINERMQIFPQTSTQFENGKEITKSFFTVIGGVIGILASYYTAVILCGVIPNPVVAWLMKLVGEMITGQCVQNMFIVLGDVVTCWREWKAKTKDEWEELANSEMIKIPFLGCLYSLLRPLTCRLIGKEDLELNNDSAINALINIFASNVGLGAGYGFMLLAHHPTVAKFCHDLWDRCQWADEFGRFLFVQKGWLERLMLSLFPAFGKGLGSGTRFGLNSLAQHL